MNPTATINDPLGRLNPQTGRVLTVQNGSLGSPFLGMSTLYQWYDSSANSIGHAGYINVVHRERSGLTLTANYTWAKSIDTASSAGGDKNILTAVGGSVGGQVAFGGTRASDRAVSTYHQRHVIHGSAIYDLPFGKGRRFINKSRLLDYPLGGWTVRGITRIQSGFPYLPYLSDANQLGDLTHSIRPNVTPGVPLINPLWTRTCPTGAGCQPYVNPAAFQRPALGAYGNAPRTLDGVRGPMSQNVDISLQKSFKLGEGSRRLQFRVDLLNALEPPHVRCESEQRWRGRLHGRTEHGDSDDSGTQHLGRGERPAVHNDCGNRDLQPDCELVNSYKVNGVLPANSFTTPLPANFYGVAANSYDITKVDGYKNYQLRNAYSTTFGTLYNNSVPRFIQFGVKLYF